MPTESSYALAADPTSSEGVAAIYAFKRRPPGKPLPVVGADRDQLLKLGVRLDADPLLERLSGLWPAALTLVAPLERDVAAAAGGGSLAVRVPADAGLRQLLSALGRPLTATSANRSGEAPIVDPDLLAEELAGSSAVLVDRGVLPGGEPSTLVAVAGGEARLLRRGAFPPARVEEEISAASVEISSVRGGPAPATSGA